MCIYDEKVETNVDVCKKRSRHRHQKISSPLSFYVIVGMIEGPTVSVGSLLVVGAPEGSPVG